MHGHASNNTERSRPRALSFYDVLKIHNTLVAVIVLGVATPKPFEKARGAFWSLEARD